MIRSAASLVATLFASATLVATGAAAPAGQAPAAEAPNSGAPAGQTAPASAVPASAGAPAAEYLLGPDDVIQVQIWGRSDLSGQSTIESSGKIRLPLVGEIDAGGLTPVDLGRTLTERYQLLDPSIPEVMITVAQYNNQSVTVVGEVHSPGRYGFRTMPDLWNIILTAGGPTRDADLANVQIVHRDAKEGEANTINADLSRGIDGTARENLPLVRSKDTVVVPTLTGTPGGDRFQMQGAVRTPGLYRTNTAKNVLEAIAVCGGSLPEADLSQVCLTRTSGAGVVSYRLNLRGYLYDARPDANLQLQAGDIVTVPPQKTGLSFLTSLGRLTPIISMITALASLSLVLHL